MSLPSGSTGVSSVTLGEIMDERTFFNESQATKPAELTCPFCRTTEKYDLRWMVRKKKDRMPTGADPNARAKFQKAQSYMVLLDDKVACKNLRCRKRFDISGVKTMAFLADAPPSQRA